MGKEMENMNFDESDPHIHETKEELSTEKNGIITQQEEEEGQDGQQLAGQETENGNENTPQKGNGNDLYSENASMKAQPAQSDNCSRRLDEEDSYSITSSIGNAASGKTSKGKITVASGPVFKCSARAEKRREFYQKLEEKHQAMEEQKNQTEARAKKEQDAIMRQFRKSLTFKATPMPSFYQEGPPPKTELKKVPTTRAKSPKLGRRKSYSDASGNKNPSESNHTKGRTGNRHSLDSSSKDSGAKNTIGNVVPKDRVNKPVPARAHKVNSNERVVNIALQT